MSSGGGGYLGPRAAANSARAAEIALQQNEAWNNFRVQDERMRRETQQVSLQGVPGVGPTNLGRAQGAEFHMGAPGTEMSPKDAIGSLASGRMAANFMQNAYAAMSDSGSSLPVPPSSDPLRKYRFVTNEEAHEADLRRNNSHAADGGGEEAFASYTRMGSGAQTHHDAPDEDDDFGMSARQKRVLADIEKRNEEMTDDLFDDGPYSYARFFKRNLASTSVFLLVLSLLVYTSLDPVASDFILKLSLSSPLNERLSSRDAHTLHMVDSEEVKVRGVWWRVESLEGSGKPSTYHNQWDLAGILFFSDDACKIPMTLGSDGAGGSIDASAQLSSESTHHEWHKLPKTRPGWGFLEPTGGAYINEPQSGGSRVSVHITGPHASTMPRCVAIGSCFIDGGATAAGGKKGGGGVYTGMTSDGSDANNNKQHHHHRRQLLKKGKGKPATAETEPMIVSATMDTVESLPAMYGEVEAPCDAEHFPKYLQLAVYDASTEEWVEVLRFSGSEMRQVKGFTGLSLRTILVPEDKRRLAAGAAGGKTLPQMSVDDVDSYGHVNGKETLLDVNVEAKDSALDASKVDGEVGSTGGGAAGHGGEV